MKNTFFIGSIRVIFALLCCVIIFAMFIQHAVASQLPSPSPFPLLTQNTLFPDQTASPSVATEFPLLSSFEKTIEQQTASEGAKTENSNEDYCIHLPVIMYHHIQPLQLASLLGHEPLTVDSAIFDEHIKYLKEHGYHAVATDELISALTNGTTLPEKSVMITIDDGYDDNYTYAFMTAKKYQFVVNFMIPTGLINNPGYMNWDHLREMRDNPYARIYNHTKTHAALGSLSKEGIEQEIITANNDFDRELGKHSNIVTYPYGSYNDLAIQTLKDLGIVAAISTDPGENECRSNIMRLPRIRVANAPLETYGF